MRLLRRSLLWLLGILALIVALCFLTGNGHIPRGVWFTYLKGRSAPEIDDRNFFPSSAINTGAAQPWAVHLGFGKLSLTHEEEQALTVNSTVGFVLIKNDSLLFEQYWNGWNKDSVSNAFSVAKSYISLLTGIALQEGKIDDVFQKVGTFLPEFDDAECKKAIDLRHLLTMSTGLDWSESGADPFSDNAKGYYGYDVSELARTQPCRDKPGEKFDYISGSTQIMADVLEKAYGQPLDRLVEEKIWKPLGAEHTAWWGKDTENGDFKGFCCLYATARDFARIGQLWLDSGAWHGRRIIPQEYWQASISPAALDDKGSPNRRYGYYWWLMEVDGRPLYYCRGFHGQYVVVIPHERTIMVRTGMKWEEKNELGHPKDVMTYIGIARRLAASAN